MNTLDNWPAPPWLAYAFGDCSQPWQPGASWRLPGRVVPPQQVVHMQQVHGNSVAVVSAAEAGSCVPGVDALVTAEANVFLLVRTADCLPLLLVDPAHGVVAAAHSGREGTRQNIAGECLRAMTQCFSTQPRDVLAALGPAIAACSYQVDEATHARFMRTALAAHPPGRLDIRAEVEQQLLHAGVLPVNIAHLPHDTRTHPRYFSWRGQQTPARQVSLIGKITVDENNPQA